MHGGSQCFISLHIRDSRRFNLSKFLQPGCSSASVSKSSIGHGYFKNEICAAKLLHLDSGLRNFLTGFGHYARFTQGEHEYAKVVAGQAGDTAPLMNEIGRIKKTPAEKERMMDSLKIARLEIFERVHQNLPEQLRNRDEINRAIAEQINYATASSQFEDDDEEMRRKLNALFDKLRRNGADEAANEMSKAVAMRPHYLALAESNMR